MNPLTLAPEALPDLVSRLTPRQLEIVGLLAEGKSVIATATILSISRDMVNSHILKARQKLELDNRIQLIVLYVMWKVSNGNE